MRPTPVSWLGRNFYSHAATSPSIGGTYRRGIGHIHRHGIDLLPVRIHTVPPDLVLGIG